MTKQTIIIELTPGEGATPIGSRESLIAALRYMPEIATIDFVLNERQPPIPVYFVDCSTGCTCCCGENHERGPFSSRAIAEARVVQYREHPVLASQYAPRGVYRICEREAEVLPGGRLIVDDRVYGGFVDDVDPRSEEEKCAA